MTARRPPRFVVDAVDPGVVDVPVVGDLVVVEDHQRRDVRQHAAHLGQHGAEQLDVRAARSSHDSLLTSGSTSGGITAGSSGTRAAPPATAPATRRAGTSPGTRRRSTGGWPSRRCSRARRARSSPADRGRRAEHVRLVDADEVARDAQHARHQRVPDLVGVDLVARQHQQVRLRRGDRTACETRRRAPARRGRRRGACGTTCGGRRPVAGRGGRGEERRPGGPASASAAQSIRRLAAHGPVSSYS